MENSEQQVLVRVKSELDELSERLTSVQGEIREVKDSLLKFNASGRFKESSETQPAPPWWTAAVDKAVKESFEASPKGTCRSTYRDPAEITLVVTRSIAALEDWENFCGVTFSRDQKTSWIAFRVEQFRKMRGLLPLW